MRVRRSRWLARAAVAGAVTLLLSCGRTTEERTGPAPAECLPGEEQAGLIAERLTDGATTLRSAWAVALDPPVDNYFYVVAAEISGEAVGTDRQIGVWGVGSYLGGARIMALDAAARRWSDWGRSIPRGTPAGEQRSRMADRPEVDRARSCVSNEPGPSSP